MGTSVQSYWEILLEVPAETLEAVSHLLEERGSGGAVIDDEGELSAPGRPGRAARVGAYFPAGPAGEARLAAVREALRRFAGCFPDVIGAPVWWRETMRPVDETDWAEAWKAHFKPFRVGRQLVIVPSWEDYRPADGDVILRLDPGMAFGTGTHASTALCLEALERLIHPGADVLDVGTGSGILAIAVALLGARRVTALDVDPVAVRVAGENIVANGVSARVEARLGEAAGEPAAAYDLVLANLTAGIHAEVHADLARALRPGGTLVASGIIAEEADRVERIFGGDGLRRCERLEREGWAALVLAFADRE